MSKIDLMKMTKSLWREVGKQSPQLLTGIGIAGMITTTVLAVKATPKALRLMDSEKVKKGRFELTPTETVKVAWKPYVPAIVTGVVSTICLVSSCSVSTRRTAAIATAYKLSETALAEFREKAVEVVGEKKVKEIKEKIVEDKMIKDPVSKKGVIIAGGNTLCYDSISGRYFNSDIETIKKAVNEINRQMTYDMYVSLTEFYNEIGLEPTSISDEIGWNLDDGLVEMNYTSKLADDGTPCLSLEYNIAPRYDFSRLF